MTQRVRDNRAAGGLKQHALTAASLAVLVAGIGLAIAYGDSVTALRDELENWGALSALAFIVFEALWMLTTVPAVPLMVLAGLVYGIALGTLYSVIGGVLGSALIFVIGRRMGRARLVSLSRRSDGVGRALELIERHPVASILIVRAVPMFPLNLLNYGFGATSIRFRTYLITTALVLLPAAAFYAGVGNAVQRASLGQAVPVTEIVWLAVFAVLSAATIWYARRRARASGTR